MLSDAHIQAQYNTTICEGMDWTVSDLWSSEILNFHSSSLYYRGASCERASGNMTVACAGYAAASMGFGIDAFQRMHKLFDSTQVERSKTKEGCCRMAYHNFHSGGVTVYEGRLRSMQSVLSKFPSNRRLSEFHRMRCTTQIRRPN